MTSKIFLSILTIYFAHTATAENILAQKKGSVKRYAQCSLSESHGTIQINDSLNRYHLSETSRYQHDFYDVERIVTPAIKGIEGMYYRWNAIQTDYLIKDDNDSLIKFYSFGLTNIINKTPQARTLIEDIDRICDFHLRDFSIIGEFQIDLQIGNRVFKDSLIIQRDEGFFGVHVKGIYSVPNSFNSKIKSLNYKDGRFSFTIRVQEGEDDYEAKFEGILNSSSELKGRAFILPSNEELGSFTGKRL